MAMPAEESRADILRISSSELARRPRQLMDEVLRENVVIVQNRGRDVAAVLDIREYQRLLRAVGAVTEKESC